jgi:phage tail protein X
MPARQEHRNRPTHRIADGDHSLCAKFTGNGGGIVGAVFEAEGFVGSQTATVTAMVDANHGRKLTEFVIGGEEVEVA